MPYASEMCICIQNGLIVGSIKKKKHPIKWKFEEGGVELGAVKPPQILRMEAPGGVNRHLWLHGFRINDTCNNILLYRCKIHKLGEENGSVIEMHKSRKPGKQADGRWQGAGLGRQGTPAAGSTHLGFLEHLPQGAAAQAPSLHI